MGKITKDEQLRREGMAYALKVAKEKGVEGLEAELRFRGAYNVPLSIPQSTLDQFTLNVKQHMFDTLSLLTSATLHDEFGFGKERIQRFIKRLNLKAECIADDYASWQEYQQIMKDECGLDFKLSGANDRSVKI
jgi:hypothetical protein